MRFVAVGTRFPRGRLEEPEEHAAVERHARDASALVVHVRAERAHAVGRDRDAHVPRVRGDAVELGEGGDVFAEGGQVAIGGPRVLRRAGRLRLVHRRGRHGAPARASGACAVDATRDAHAHHRPTRCVPGGLSAHSSR